VVLAFAKLALLAAAWTEIAWWEGRWADEGVPCNVMSPDRPMTLSWNKLDLGEAECVGIREHAVKHAVRLTAKCRDHGETSTRVRSFTLRPSHGGRAMAMSDDADAIWHLRKCK
jgi:hypothetical protein